VDQDCVSWNIGLEPFGSELKAEGLKAEWLRYARNDSTGDFLRRYQYYLSIIEIWHFLFPLILEGFLKNEFCNLRGD
jgi:hypothetical protein